MFSKMVLPMLGGTPQVWNTAMLFFQATLLAGYAYAHGTTRFLSIPVQAAVHVALLIACVVFLPLAIPAGWTPPTDSDPTLWQLSLMAVSIGGPFFVIAGSAPMLQRWFSATPHPDADNPYFLYGASNLGSMTVLLSYPFIIDPLLALNEQSSTWSIGYIGLIVLSIFAAILVCKGGVFAKRQAVEKNAAATKSEISWKLRLSWLFWAFIPSSMMLGVTTYITTDIATAPLLWIVPLALYVGSFIIVFSRKQIISNLMITHLLFAGLCMILLFSFGFGELISNPFIIIGIHFSFFFIAAVACHQRLADLKPSPVNLTEFYLIMSVGGVLGGFFNAIIAPQFFISAVEYPIAICLAVFARYSWQDEQSFSNFVMQIKSSFARDHYKVIINERNMIPCIIIASAIFIFLFESSLMSMLVGIIIIILLADSYQKRWLSTFLILFLLCLFPPTSNKLSFETELLQQERNFFGIIRVMNMNNSSRILLHGTTTHGVQALDEENRLLPLSYYSYESPLSDVVDLYNPQSGAQNFAVIGLGSGVTACYRKDKRHFDFFEIDPSVARIAQDPQYFTFLSDCGSPYDVILGDGRLTIREQADHKYDMISLDAFSSDSIPVHLITLEAIELYLSKLKPDGVLLFHISNRHLDLESVLSIASEKLDIPSFAKVSLYKNVEGTKLDYFPTHYVAFTADQEKIEKLKADGWDETRKVDGVKLWTDQYSNILSVFGSTITKERINAAERARKAERAAKAE